MKPLFFQAVHYMTSFVFQSQVIYLDLSLRKQLKNLSMACFSPLTSICQRIQQFSFVPLLAAILFLQYTMKFNLQTCDWLEIGDASH